MPKQKTAKQRVTTSLPARVLSATGDAVNHRRLGQEIDTAFRERDDLRVEVEQLREQVSALKARLQQEIAFHYEAWFYFNLNAGLPAFIDASWATVPEPERPANYQTPQESPG